MTSAVLAAVCLLPALHAQTAPAADAETPMFRVYANLLQIPVLILDKYRRPVAPIPPEKFRIQLDEETPVRPRQVRLQGEDPITLAVLVSTLR